MLTWTSDVDQSRTKNGDEQTHLAPKERARARGEEAGVVLFGACFRSQSRVRRSEAKRKQQLESTTTTMAQPKQGLSLLKFIPKAMRPSTSDVSSVALWGTTAAMGALWLVQPFDWIKAQISGAPAEEEQK